MREEWNLVRAVLALAQLWWYRLLLKLILQKNAAHPDAVELILEIRKCEDLVYGKWSRPEGSTPSRRPSRLSIMLLRVVHKTRFYAWLVARMKELDRRRKSGLTARRKLPTIARRATRS